jgi:hypothetical protein
VEEFAVVKQKQLLSVVSAGAGAQFPSFSRPHFHTPQVALTTEFARAEFRQEEGKVEDSDIA